jgi:hypothetical protein
MGGIAGTVRSNDSSELNEEGASMSLIISFDILLNLKRKVKDGFESSEKKEKEDKIDKIAEGEGVERGEAEGEEEEEMEKKRKEEN